MLHSFIWPALERLTLNVEGDAVCVHLLVVNGNAGERLSVSFSAGHQNVVALNGDRPVRVYVLSGGCFSWDLCLPPAHIHEAQRDV